MLNAYNLNLILFFSDLNFSEDQIKSLALADIESLMRINGSSLTIFKI